MSVALVSGTSIGTTCNKVKVNDVIILKGMYVHIIMNNLYCESNHGIPKKTGASYKKFVELGQNERSSGFVVISGLAQGCRSSV